MKREIVSIDEIEREYEKKRNSNHHIDARLLSAIPKARRRTLLILEDEGELFSLIWQETDATRFLTGDRSRCLGQVAARLLEIGLSFEQLTHNQGYGQDEHDPNWFLTCHSIDENFEFQQFGWIVIVPAIPAESKRCHDGSYYIFDGVHRSLVLSKRLVAGEEKFQPVQALLLEPRP